ncbi:MAG TPA: hypothetical protein VFI24_10605 [Pyrinomonadaceae bacterium]|nr:hypothetical protein [Pyrinomonadaceae bacterium]
MRAIANVRFPVVATPPFIGASCGNHLHLVMLDATGQQAQHFALADTGTVVGPVASLPLTRIEAINTCENSVVISGWQGTKGNRSIVRLDAQGHVIGQGELPVVDPLMVSPKLTCNGERFSLVWSVNNRASRLCVVTVNGDSPGEPLEFEFADPIFDLCAVASEHAVTVACIHGGSTTSLELILISNEEIAHRLTIEDATRPSSPSLVIAGGEVILFWLTKPEHELRAQHFDEALQPLGPASVIASSNELEMRVARVFQGRDDRLAVSYVAATQSDEWTVISENNEADRYETAFKHEQFLARYDFGARRAEEFQKIDGPAVSYPASGWANDSLLLISAGPEPSISIYQ